MSPKHLFNFDHETTKGRKHDIGKQPFRVFVIHFHTSLPMENNHGF